MNSPEMYMNSNRDDEEMENDIQEFMNMILNEEDESEYTEEALSMMSVAKLRDIARKLKVDNMTKKDIRFAKKQELVVKILEFLAKS